jgi:hypothetical protein
MGQGRGAMEGIFRMNANRVLWGLRPWKRHGKILTGAGIVYALIGIAYIAGRNNRNRQMSLEILLKVAPMPFWGGLFIFAGVLAIISSRWPRFSDTWGYVVLTSLSVGWGMAYLMGVVFLGSPWSNISGFLLWSLFGFLWWGISGLANPHRPREDVADGSR